MKLINTHTHTRTHMYTHTHTHTHTYTHTYRPLNGSLVIQADRQSTEQGMVRDQDKVNERNISVRFKNIRGGIFLFYPHHLKLNVVQTPLIIIKKSQGSTTAMWWACTFKYSSWMMGRRCWQNIKKALAGFFGALGSLSFSSLIFLLLLPALPETLAATAAIVLSPSPCAANKGWMAERADCFSLTRLLRAGEGASLSEPPG